MATGSLSLPDVVKQAFDEIAAMTGLAFDDERLVLAVSGGPDSLALLHVLRELWPAEALVVAHFDHGLRPDSAADARFVRALAAEWGLAYRGGAADVRAVAGQTGQGLEEAGRQARYTFLAEVAAAEGAAAVVTGHHADDQAETVLMHILRGSGLAGLRGMVPATPLPADSGIWLLRPLLAADRAAIEAYCRDHNLQPLRDDTNQDTTYYRNRLRHELLPILETYNPHISGRLRQLADIATADLALLESLTDEALGDLVLAGEPGWLLLDQAAWSQLPLSIRRSTLRAAHQALAPEERDVGFRTLEATRTAAEAPTTGQQSDLPGGVTLYVLSEGLLLTTLPTFPPQAGPQLMAPQPVPLKVPGRLALANGWVLSTSRVPADSFRGAHDLREPWVAYVTVEEKASLVVRGRLEGERMQPLGLAGRSTSLKEIMIDRKIPAALRARWPIVATDHAVWLVGHVLDERHRVTAGSKRVVRIECVLEGY